ncbi:nuclear transport factor 2 family protein [Undibacterium sp. Di26W]|uniref:nuclear transport factor 2 family protein n=1 Tax=Undibacterium sp. Di26W TaxID=3413035 RepID=UPI003BEFA7E9
MNADYCAIHNRLAKFANSFDLKDWDGLCACLAPSVYTDYSDLRGTPPEQMSNRRYADLRRIALQDLKTHHISGNIEIEIEADTAKAKVSTMIYRQDAEGTILHTHCLYEFGLQKMAAAWYIDAIVQKVFWSDGSSAIHRGIVR